MAVITPMDGGQDKKKASITLYYSVVDACYKLNYCER